MSCVQRCVGQRGKLRAATILTQIGLQFGQTIGRAGALRSAVTGSKHKYGDRTEPHARKRSACSRPVFEENVSSRLRGQGVSLRAACAGAGGTGVLPAGEIPETLLDLMTELACKLASEFLSICIRAIDYCPPVDITFGEYLRAVITADSELVPDDRWGYRESWIDAFRKYGIYPSDMTTLAEDSLVWRGPERTVPAVAELGFAHLQFAGDPARPASAAELERQARALGALVTDPQYLDVFGLAKATDPRLGGDAVELPKIESIRTARRVGPSGQIVFDLVAEVTQRRIAPTGNARRGVVRLLRWQHDHPRSGRLDSLRDKEVGLAAGPPRASAALRRRAPRALEARPERDAAPGRPAIQTPARSATASRRLR